MKALTLLLLFALGSALLVSCDKSGSSAETEELKRRLEQLEEEKAERERLEAAKKQAATEEELAAARDQLQMALDALEREKAKPVPEVNVDQAGKAVVVQEPRPAVVKDPKLATEVTEVVPVDGADYRVFFDELSPHGEWFETNDYGYVWQPGVARSERGWRPYTKGQWLHAEEGWTWASEEPFGWATFHYGRWTLLERHGWAWVPGEEWAPAWVSWRQSNEYIGWAPLPPETLYNRDQAYDERVDAIYDLAPSWYAFVPVRNFQGPVGAHCVPSEAVMQIVVQTENVTRVERRKEGMYCGGPQLDWVARQTGGQVRSCTVHRHPERMAGAGQQHLRGNRLEVFAPRVQAPWNSAVRPQRVSGNWGRVSTVRGGGAMDERVLERFRGERLARHDAARRAMEREDVRQALIRDRVAREEAARQAATRCQRDVHGQLERDLEAARVAFDAAQARFAQGGLNSQRRAQAGLAVKNAEDAYLAADAAYVDHMQRFHAEEWLQLEARRAREEAARRTEEERRRQMVCRPSEHQQLEESYNAALREVNAADQAVAKGNLNPRQLAYAKLVLKNATKKLATAEEGFMNHLLKHHPEDHRQVLADRARRESQLAARAENERQKAEARRRAETQARAAEERAKADALRQAEMRAESERRARLAAEEKARAEAERLAKLDAERRAEEEQRQSMVCNVEEHRQLEAAWKAAAQASEAAAGQLRGNLNPKQMAYARQRAGAAAKKLQAAEGAFLAHLQKHHPAEHGKFQAERAGAGAGAAAAQAEAERLAMERAKAEAQRVAMEEERARGLEAAAEEKRRKDAAMRAALQQERLEQERAKAEADRLAQERAKAEAQRAAMEAKRKGEESARMEAERQAAVLAKAEAQAEAERIKAEKLKQQERDRMAAERAAALAAQQEAVAKAKGEAERMAREQAARQTPSVCQPAVHQQLENAFKAAQLAADAAEKNMKGGLNPKQAAYARKVLGEATKKLSAAQGAYDAHMQQHHAAEWKAIVAARAAEAKKAKARGGDEGGRGSGRKR